MTAQTKFQAFVEDLAEKVHNLGSDQLTVALCAAANAPVNTNAQLSDLVEIAYTNLSTRNITTSASAQSAGVYKLTLTDLVLTASGGAVATFRYVVIYNNTSTNDRLISFLDYGSNITLADGESLTLDFSAANGLLQLT